VNEENMEKALERSVCGTAGLTSIYQLVDRTGDEMFSFHEHETTADSPIVVVSHGPAPFYQRPEAAKVLPGALPFTPSPLQRPQADAATRRPLRAVTSIPSPLPRHKELGLAYEAVLEEDEEGGFVATIPGLRGCVSQGDSLEEALGHLENALSGWLEVAQKRGLHIPLPDQVEAP